MPAQLDDGESTLIVPLWVVDGTDDAGAGFDVVGSVVQGLCAVLGAGVHFAFLSRTRMECG